ncbi:MAG: hypothetical protein HPY75_03550 [Actinobacteria bacterium]|nr:hypothetical protein [Actinomycetota bacterium]
MALLSFALLSAFYAPQGDGGRAVAATGEILLCSSSASGEPANKASYSQANTPDGRYVVFASSASNLVAGDTNGKDDIFRKDMSTGSVVRCSTGSSGEEANDNCSAPSISADGRYVAFHSKASNLVAGDGNGVDDVFLKDLVTGSVVRCSTDQLGGEANGASQNPSLSADGSRVAFESAASDLVAGDGNGVTDVFMKDVAGGAVTRISCDSGGSEGNNDSSHAAISADGKFVAFVSNASNLAAGDGNGTSDVFRKDTSTGAVEVCSATATGTVGNGWSNTPSISADGRYVAFSSRASNLVTGDGNGASDVFRKDLQTGSILRCSTDSNGVEAYYESSEPCISPDGRYVALCSVSALVWGFYTGYREVYLKDTVTGKVKLCSSSESNSVARSSSPHPTVSLDGQYVFFYTDSYNLVEGVGGRYQVFRKRPLYEPPHLTSVSPGAGPAGSEITLTGTLFGNTRAGSYVAFGDIEAEAYSHWSDGEIKCTVPAEAYGRLMITVHTGEGVSNAMAFTVCPHIDLLDPVAAPIGCPVEILGTGFGPSRGSGFVIFGGTQVSEYLSWSNTRVVVRVPRVSGATSVSLMSDAGCHSNEASFEVFDYAVALAEGYTGAGFQQYLCIGNPNDQAANVEIYYFFPDGTYLDDALTVSARSRETLDVNNYVNPYFEHGTEVSTVVFSDLELAVERPMYFHYQGRWTGGHTVTATPYISKVWCFAEGYTGAGFEEYVCVFNPNDAPANLNFYFQTKGAGEVERTDSVPAMSRRTFKVNELLGKDQECSLLLESDQMVVAERPMYFDYTGLGNHHWEGGHCVMGLPYLSREYFFAEGTTREGFEEWLTIQNPNPDPITVIASYQLGEGQGTPVMKSYVVAPESRHTVNVQDEVGREKDASIKLASEDYFLAERPMYFRYTGHGASWEGGHCVIGASDLSSEWFFAEGCTGSGFQEWLCLQNPSGTDAVLEISYMGKSGPVAVKEVSVPAGTRKTLRVNDEAGEGQEISCSLRVKSGPPVMAERPMYFDFRGWDDGHDVVGYIPYGSASTQAAGLQTASLGETCLLRNHPLRPGARTR